MRREFALRAAWGIMNLAVIVVAEGVGRVGVAGGSQLAGEIVGVSHCGHNRVAAHPVLGGELVQIVIHEITHSAISVGDAGHVRRGVVGGGGRAQAVGFGNRAIQRVDGPRGLIVRGVHELDAIAGRVQRDLGHPAVGRGGLNQPIARVVLIAGGVREAIGRGEQFAAMPVGVGRPVAEIIEHAEGVAVSVE